MEITIETEPTQRHEITFYISDKLVECIIYVGQVLTDEEVKQIENYFMEKWDTTDSSLKIVPQQRSEQQ